MSVNPSLKRLWLMISVVSVTIAITVYLGVIPAVKGYPIELQGLEERLLSDNLLPSETLAEAAVSGGMSRGGSFSRPASPAPALPRSAPSRGYDYGYRSAPGPVIMPYPTYAPAPVYVGPSTGGGGGGLFLVVIVLGFIILPIALNYLRSGSSATGGPTAPGSQSELLNDIVTVTQLQVALLADARELQRDLTTLTLNAKLNTSSGLANQLRETVLALLRHPDYWTHARADSKTIAGREKASELFDRLSIQERSKFSVETLINVGGKVQQRAMPSGSGREVASHIVVTLLLGTADDRPLLGSIQSVADLKSALQRLGSISPDYLLVYELLWSPQNESDSLSSDELIVNYPELVVL